jgi:hypothetical protein
MWLIWDDQGFDVVVHGVVMVQIDVVALPKDSRFWLKLSLKNLR